MLLETYNYVSSISYLYFDANFKVLFDDNVIYPPVKYPYIENTKEDLESGKFSGVTINRGDLTTWDRLLLHVAKVEKPIKEDESIVYYANECVIDLTLDYSVDDSHYVVPKEKLNISFSNDVEYIFVLSSSASSLGALSSDDIYDQISFVVSGLTGNEQLEGKQDLTNQKIDETNKKLDEQTDAIKDQTETNKNIFERLGELLNFLNPFSKDFFVYKLIELLGDLIKSLFVPSDDFLSNWFTEVSDYFEDAFGILYYPIDLVIQVLGRFDNISGQEPVISFGNFSLFGAVLIPSYTYNFNDILSNDTLKTIHDFYLITIDVILWLGLLVYCKNVIANIFGGKFTDDVIDEIQDPGGTEKSYNNYSRYQENKRRYKQEHGGNRK